MGGLFVQCVGCLYSGCDDDKKLKVDFKSISCKVCNAPSSGFHFGAITCEGCKVCLRNIVPTADTSLPIVSISYQSVCSDCR